MPQEKSIEEKVQDKLIQLKFGRIEEVVEGWQTGQLSAFSAMLVICRIVDPPVITPKERTDTMTDHLWQAKNYLEGTNGRAVRADVRALRAIGHALVALVEQLKSQTVVVDNAFSTLRILSNEELAAIEEAVAQAIKGGKR